jgi:hypothetical protein
VSRVQLALNVDDLDQSVAFYSTLFGVGPAKVRPGYANFAVAEPPLKLVLSADTVARNVARSSTSNAPTSVSHGV